MESGQFKTGFMIGLGVLVSLIVVGWLLKII